MSTDGTRVVASALSKSDGTNSQQGAAYVYSGDGYTSETKLIASDGAPTITLATPWR